MNSEHATHDGITVVAVSKNQARFDTPVIAVGNEWWAGLHKSRRSIALSSNFWRQLPTKEWPCKGPLEDPAICLCFWNSGQPRLTEFVGKYYNGKVRFHGIVSPIDRISLHDFVRSGCITTCFAICRATHIFFLLRNSIPAFPNIDKLIAKYYLPIEAFNRISCTEICLCEFMTSKICRSDSFRSFPTDFP